MKTRKCTPIEEKWAQAYACKGMTKSDAWRAVHPTKQVSDETAYVSGCRFSKRPAVMARVQELLSEMAVDSIVSGQQILRNLLDDRELAMNCNLPGTAVQADHILARHKALLQDRIALEQSGTDTEQVIAALAGGDSRKAAQLKAILGSDEEFADLEVIEGGKTG